MTLIDVIKSFQGDERYLENGFNKLKDRNRIVSLGDFADFIEKDQPRDSNLKSRELESMISKFGADRKRPTEVDINNFIDKFIEVRDKKNIRTGRYDGPNAKDQGR
jgi:hypothetical protein